MLRDLYEKYVTVKLNVVSIINCPANVIMSTILLFVLIEWQTDSDNTTIISYFVCDNNSNEINVCVNTTTVFAFSSSQAFCELLASPINPHCPHV